MKVEQIWQITDAQRNLAAKLRQKGWRVEENQVIAGAEADILLPEFKLIIELDGFFHLSKVNRQNDLQKTMCWQREGYHVLRFSNGEIRHKSAQCIKEIEQEIRSQIRAKRGQNDRPVLMEHKGLNQLRQELLNQERIRGEQGLNESVEAFFLRLDEELWDKRDN